MELFDTISAIAGLLAAIVFIHAAYTFYRYRKDMSELVHCMKDNISDLTYEQQGLKVRVRTLENVYKKRVQSINDLKKRMKAMEDHYPAPTVRVRKIAEEHIESPKVIKQELISVAHIEYIKTIVEHLQSGESYEDKCFSFDVSKFDNPLRGHIGVPRASIKSDISKMNTVINKHMQRHYETFESITLMSDLHDALSEYNWIEEITK